MVETKFVCAKCGIEHDELWSFSSLYGNNPLKKKDNNDYCKMHFDKKEMIYDACLDSYNSLAEPSISIEHYSLTFTNG